MLFFLYLFFFFFQAEDGIRDLYVTGVQTCALPISHRVPVGRDGGLRCSPAIGHRPDRRHGERQPHTTPGHRRCRTDPREHAATATPARPSSGAPSCEEPTCGFDPRTSVWRFADPPCPRAACQSRSPATPSRGGLLPPRRCAFHPGPRVTSAVFAFAKS